jgi:hypothetical protein
VARRLVCGTETGFMIPEQVLWQGDTFYGTETLLWHEDWFYNSETDFEARRDVL